MSVNKVILLGNITKDTELKQIPSGISVGTTAIALNETYTDANGVKQEKTEFVNLVVWGKLAETFANHVNKGQKVYIEGKIVTRKWEAQDGTNRYATEVVVQRMEFAGGKSDGNTQTSTSKGKAKPQNQNYSADEEISIEDIPF